MVLAKPVTNQTGVTVLPAGTELDQDLLKRLARMNLSAVYVEGTSGAAGATSLAELEAAMVRRFRKVAADPAQIMIRDAIRRQLQAAQADAAQGGSA
jgi:tryptophan synthase alpha subunit